MNFSNEKAGWKAIADMKTPRAGAFTWVDYRSKKIYVAGGVTDSSNTVTNTVEVYDIASNTWGQAGTFQFI